MSETLFWIAFALFVIALVLMACNAVVERRLFKHRSEMRRLLLKRLEDMKK
jgi:hypothetical protein